MPKIIKKRFKSYPTSLSVIFLIMLVLNPSVLYAQAEPKFSRLSLLEASSEMKAYQKDLISGMNLTEKHKRLLLNEGLAQLFLDGNRLERLQVRQRLQKIFFDSISDPAAYKSARDLAVTKLETLARSNKISINGSINAALFLGELKEKTGQLVQTATEPLSRLVTDESITPAVRIAALLGLGSRTKEARESTKGSPIAVNAVSIIPTLGKIIMLPAEQLPAVARDWMQARTLSYASDLLPLLGDDSKNLIEISNGAVVIIKDPTRSIDLRIRSIVFLSLLAGTDIVLPASEIMTVTDKLVRESLREAYGTIQDKKFEEEITGIGIQGGGDEMMGFDPMGTPIEIENNYLPITASFRASWRLVTLADSMNRLAGQMNDDKETYKKNAERLRAFGVKIYEEPKDASITSAIEEFDPESIVLDIEDPETTDPENEASPKKFSPFKLQ
ncbi:MAG: hypothetical protein CMJ66_11130 [Planctomycetaceae bacterium]|nr:hypothetical protein [Planctomycetaceae bacterium]